MSAKVSKANDGTRNSIRVSKEKKIMINSVTESDRAETRVSSSDVSCLEHLNRELVCLRLQMSDKYLKVIADEKGLQIYKALKNDYFDLVGSLEDQQINKNEFKAKIENYIYDYELPIIKDKLESIVYDDSECNSIEGLIKMQDIITEAKERRDYHHDILFNKFRFVPNKCLNVSCMGRMVHGHWWEYQPKTKITSFPTSEPLKLNDILIVPEKNIVVLSDHSSASLYILDLKSTFINRFQHDLIKKPLSLCRNIKNEIYVFDAVLCGMLVFDLNMNYIKQLKFKDTDPLLPNENNSIKIAMDPFSAELKIYIALEDLNQIRVFNVHGTAELNNTIKIDHPSLITFSENMIYVLSKSYTEYSVVQFSKQDNSLISKINIGQLLEPYGFFYDSSYLFVVAHQDQKKSKFCIYVLNDEKQIDQVSLWSLDEANGIVFDKSRIIQYLPNLNVFQFIEFFSE